MRCHRCRTAGGSSRGTTHRYDCLGMFVAAPSPAVVREVRAFARRRCAEQQIAGDRCDALELAVSELFGNAVRHWRRPLSYEVAADGDDLVLTVTDSSLEPPGNADHCGPRLRSRTRAVPNRAARPRLGWGWGSPREAETGCGRAHELRPAGARPRPLRAVAAGASDPWWLER